MRIEDRIIKAEQDFYNENLLTPNIVLMAPYVAAELEGSFTVVSDEEMYYEGLRVFIDFSDSCNDFKLAYGVR